MKKTIYALLLTSLLTSCASKPLASDDRSLVQITETPTPVSTKVSELENNIETVAPKVEVSYPIDILSRPRTEFSCPNGEYYGVADKSLGVGLTLRFRTNGTFIISYEGTGGYYYYGKVLKCEENIYSFYGEVLDYTTLEHCEGEGCVTMPELLDETIDGYLKLDKDIMYYIPYQIDYNDLYTYTSDKGCKFNEN